MFTRFVSMTLKPNAGQDFTNALERQILPILRAQRGFRDEMIFVEPGSPELLAVSLWDSKEDADKYGRAVYPDLLNVLSPLIEGTPRIETYLLTYSTAHRIGLGTVPLENPNTTPVPGVGG
jgi:hypothetical protein